MREAIVSFHEQLNRASDFGFICVESLKALIDKGYLNDKSVEKIEKDIKLIKRAIQNMREEYAKIIFCKKGYIRY